jgi:uncharacterized protein (TIGR02145 family)
MVLSKKIMEPKINSKQITAVRLIAKKSETEPNIDPEEFVMTVFLKLNPEVSRVIIEEELTNNILWQYESVPSEISSDEEYFAHLTKIVEGSGRSSAVVQFQQANYPTGTFGPTNFALVTVYNTSPDQKNIVIVSETPIQLLSDLNIENAETFTDIDGNLYKTVKINNQIWMAENLYVNRFCNGEPIPEARSNEEWSEAHQHEKPACCYYNNDPETGKIYGHLYNWFAIKDSRGLAPEGWHIPTDEEWQKLVSYLGGNSSAGGKMKESGTIYWRSPNTGATNDSRFFALPGGHRETGGSFRFLNYMAFFYCANGDFDKYSYSLNYNSSAITRYDYWYINGFSVRCVKDY